MRYQAIVEYDGTDYCGFQRQREEPSIQQELEKALEKIGNTQVDVTGAGRTDSGVHALGQVIAFDIRWSHGADALQRALNANLPVNIAVVSLVETNKNFHPRYDAKKRSYEYHIYNGPTRSPIRQRMSWQVSQPLDMRWMNRAAKTIEGEHDFATFGQPPQGENTVRTVYYARWLRRDDMLIFQIEANAYLYRMVRSLVGSMKAVGDGSWCLEEFVDALEARDRSRAYQTAPALGLFLTSVSYD